MMYAGGGDNWPLAAATPPPARSMAADKPTPARLIWRDLVSSSGSASAVLSAGRCYSTGCTEVSYHQRGWRRATMMHSH